MKIWFPYMKMVNHSFPMVYLFPNGWFVMESSTKMDDLEVALFQETSIEHHVAMNSHPFPGDCPMAGEACVVVHVFPGLKGFCSIPCGSSQSRDGMLRSELSKFSMEHMAS